MTSEKSLSPVPRSFAKWYITGARLERFSHIFKVRVVVDAIPNDISGGASSAARQTLEYLKNCPTVELIEEPRIRLRFSRYLDKLSTSPLFLDLATGKSKIVTRYQKKVMAEKANIVFYINPTNNARLLSETTFFTTVWDLGHLELGWLAEFKEDRWNQKTESRLRNDLYRAKYIFVDSDETAVKTSQIYGITPSKFVVIPLIPRVEYLTESSIEVKSKKDYAIYPANFWQHKNHVTLFRAMRRVLDSGQIPIKLLLTGFDTGFGDTLERQIQILNLEEFVEIRHFVSLENLIELYLGAKMTVYPSLLGPTNIPPLESISLGVPAFASKESMTSASLSGLSGIRLLPARDETAWAKILNQKFTPIRFDAKKNQRVFERTKLENFAKIQAVIFEEYKSLIQ